MAKAKKQTVRGRKQAGRGWQAKTRRSAAGSSPAH